MSKKINELELVLPYPDKVLFPNKNKFAHFSKVGPKNALKSDCFYATREQAGPAPLLPYGDFPVYVTFVWQGSRPDSDNALAAMKAGFDGMAAALKVDDCRFEPVIISRQNIEDTDFKHPVVLVRVPLQPVGARRA